MDEYKEKLKNFVPQILSNEDISTICPILSRTINWVESLITNHNFKTSDNSKVLRKSNPIYKGKSLYEFHNTTVAPDWDSEFMSVELNNDLYTHKDYKTTLEIGLKLRKDTIQVQFDNLREIGRILCFQTGQSTHDYAPVIVSYGFVDTFDIPPIDTWMFLKEEFDTMDTSTLFCWIPNSAEKLMQETIDCEILDSYFWLDEKYPEIHMMLEKTVTFANNGYN